MVATTNAIAKIAAVVAGLGLVAMSFASFAVPAKAATVDEQIAALMAQIAALQGGSTAVSTTFTMDLTIGSTGAEVTALQNFLINHGYAIPAGATGYFGTQTQSALAAFQAAKGITPPAGYFGPLTRTAVNGMTAMAGGDTGGTSTGGLSGGEANLHNFDLVGGDDLMEGDTNTEIALAKFDVDGGDARVQRVTVDFQATTPTTYSEKPWDYVDMLSVYNGSKKVGEVDAGSKSDWDKEDDDAAHSDTTSYYTIDIPVDTIVEDGDMAELSIRADAQSSIDSTDLSQTFLVQVPTDGVRAVDSKGIQQYTGDGEETTLGFDAAESGDLTVKKSSNNPSAGVLVADSSTTSDEFDVLAFEIKNSDNADSLLTDLTVTVATGSASGSSAADITDIIRKAILTVDGEDYTGDVQSDNTIDFNDIDVSLAGDDTTKFTLSVELFGQSGHFAATGESLTASVSSGNVTAEGEDTGDAATVSGTATGELQSVAVDGGILVEGNTMSASETYNATTVSSSTGNFTLKFDVTALGDDVYIPKGIASTTAASTTYSGVLIKSIGDAAGNAVTMSLSTTADSDNTNFYVIYDGDTETFTASVSIDPTATGFYQFGVDAVRFSSVDTSLNSLQSLDVDETDSEFKTDPLNVHN